MIGASLGSARQWQEYILTVGHIIPSSMLIVAMAVVIYAAFQKTNTELEEHLRVIASRSKRQ